MATLLLAASPLAAPALAAPAAASGTTTGPARPVAGRYLVTLTDQPIATYAGGVDGIPATRPAKDAKVDVGTSAARRYRAHLLDEQTAAAHKVGAEVSRHYAVASDTFAAQLTPAQVLRLTVAKGVTSVTPDVLLHVTDDTNSTDFMGLSGRSGLWAALGGTAKAGRGVVIGDIDTGIWPESASFAAPELKTAKPSAAASDRYRPYLRGTTTVMRKADGTTFTGTCQTGDDFTAADCNQKIVSARYYGDGWLKTVPESNRADYVSPRDGEGHGTHTASTAAGDANVQARVAGRDFGTVSGVAPGAAIAVYKALWESKDGTQSGGLTSDIVAAIDQAVADGVDVINYSVGGLVEDAPDSPVQAAFRNAAAAGVFVSTAGGNSGPEASTLSNTAPWTTTVAAGTVAPHKATVVLGNGERYTGISTTVTRTVGPAPLVRAVSLKNDSAAAADAALCEEGTLDPAKTAGKLVVCDRGVNARVAKSAEVGRAGGLGMVLVNLTDGSTDGDLHSVPTVHLNTPDSTTVRAYAATDGATAGLVTGGSDVPYPQVAAFSSRGPSTASNGDILKPDITAPGVSILAAVAPPTNSGRSFDFYSGTSMAAPHISGLAALYLGLHPAWSPMAVKSAMMTTATPTKSPEGKDSDDAFAQGAGEVETRAMLRPGLVYDSTEEDWLGYLEGLGIDTGTGTKALDASDLNSASIAIGDLFGSQTVTRTVTAVTPGTYRVAVDLPGVKATVSPATLHFTKPGQRRTFTVRFDVTAARVGVTDTGSLTWTSGRTAVRSPVVVVPQTVRAPQLVTGSGAAGQLSYSVTPASTSLTATVYGPVSAPPVHGTLTGTEEQDYHPVIAGGTEAAEFSVKFDPSSALTGIVYGRWIDGTLQEGNVVLPDAHGVADVVLPKPDAGTYLVAVLAVETGTPTAATTPYVYQDNQVTADSVPTGTLAVTPRQTTTTPGTPLDLTASWSGLPADVRSTAWIEYANGAGTVVSLN
ncbi:S8 family serine peptidase [Streptomyces sp. NPDC005423]|uniref:S8 family serine peptidase n=1 Tax=Streptomyces sp. NPDC005423 TaxID=3155343 RepID=UPI0033B0E172